MPDSKGKTTKTLKDEDIKSIAEVVRAFLRKELEASMQQVANRLDAVQSELTLLTVRIVMAEGELTTQKKDTKKMSVVISNMQEKLQSYQRRFADLEDCSRRCNIWVHGMPENAEQDAPVQFPERMIPEWFPPLKHLKPEIERVQRINSWG